MKHLLLVVATLSWLGSSHLASAGAPAWCNNEKFDVNSADMRSLSSQDPKTVVEEIAKLLCTGGAEVDAHKADIETARAAWSKKLGMQDADWADVVAFAKDTYHSMKTDLSAKGLGALTPVDQYIAIKAGFKDASGYDSGDPLYLADALDGKLTEVGRLALIEYCLQNESVTRDDGNVVKWAVCQADFDKWDAAKFATELHSDTAHDGMSKMLLRFKVLELPAQLKEMTDKKAALIKKDDAYKKVYDTATKARADWAKDVGGNAKLLQLIEDTDSGVLFHSRKLLDGCEQKTADALAAAVSTLPAKAFTGMHDEREDPYKGFAASLAPLLINTPQIYVAAAAYAECQPKSATGDFLAAYLQDVPGQRGPRNAALGAIMGETYKFDDTSMKGLQYVRVGNRPYARSGGSIGSAGGIVKSVKADKEFLTVALEKTSVMQEQCVQSHSTNRLARIASDGRLEYERVCDKSAMVKVDTTWTDFKVNPAQQKILKPGVKFSSVQGSSKFGDVIAIWPSKTAKTPSWVLGGAIK